MKGIFGIFLVFLGLLQYNLWFTRGGLISVFHLRRVVANQKVVNQKLTNINHHLMQETIALKSGHEAIEGLARSDLGMIKQDEKFYQIVDVPYR